MKFKNRGKTYYFAAAGNTVEIGQNVIVETSKGLEFAQCVMGNHFVPDEKVIPPIRPVVRVARRTTSASPRSTKSASARPLTSAKRRSRTTAST